MDLFWTIKSISCQKKWFPVKENGILAIQMISLLWKLFPGEEHYSLSTEMEIDSFSKERIYHKEDLIFSQA